MARVNGRHQRCLLDSGADLSLIPTQAVSPSQISPSEQKLRAVNDTVIQMEGEVRVPIKLRDRHILSTLLVSPNVDEVILGRG